MNKRSTTITGLIVVLIGFAFEYSGVEVASTDIQTTMEVLVKFGGLFLAWYGRYKQGDVTVSGSKR